MQEHRSPNQRHRLGFKQQRHQLGFKNNEQSNESIRIGDESWGDNIDVFPAREKELIERTGSSVVPHIFFNEKLFRGLMALNSMRNSGMLEAKMKELLRRKCLDDEPTTPVYGFDDLEEDNMDEMVSVVRILRQKLPIQDRLMKMKLVKNCFSATEMVELYPFDCGRKKVLCFV